MSDLAVPGAGDLESVVIELLAQVSVLVEDARRVAGRQVNATLALRNWHTGRLISTAILRDERAEYGRQIVASLSHQLTARFGRGYEVSNLRRMVQFAREFPDEQIVVSLIRELSWTHILALLPVKSHEARVGRSSNGKSGWSSTVTTTIWICCSFRARCVVSWPWS
jgi:hypothetical protein